METESVSVEVKLETNKAYYLRDLASDKLDCTDEDACAWFPKSQIHFSTYNIKTKKATAVIPLWLLKEKGWNA